MGYYTYYDIDIKGSIDEEQFAIDFNKVTGGYQYPIEDTIKWYDYEKDMKKLSSMYPNNYFTIYGTGEDSYDIWVAYFYRGNYSGGRAKLVYPSANEEDLGNPRFNSPELFI